MIFGKDTDRAPACRRVCVVPGHTDKSREYLLHAVENERHAADAADPKFKAIFLQIARQYRKLAGQLDAPWEPEL
jgi:hypothetical protein